MTLSPPDALPPRRRSPSIRWRRWAPRAAFESLLIVFSVILALSLTGWVEDRRTAHRVADMRQFLIAEVRANRQALASSDYIPHHEQLKVAFANAGGMPGMAATPEGARPALDRLFGGSGLHLMATQNAVWTSVSSSDLFEHMDPEEVFLLARIYRAQESLDSINRAGYDNAVGLLDILSDDRNVNRDMMRMTLYLEDLIQQEKNLLGLYDRALARLEAPPAAAATRTDDAGSANG